MVNMVTYFIPRGRFLLKSSSLCHAQQKHQQYQQGKWPMLRHFRQTFSRNSSSTTVTSSPASKRATDTLVQRSAHSLSKKNKEPTSLQHKSRSKWLKWTGILWPWGPVCVFFYAAIEWQLHRQKSVREQRDPRTASNFQAKVYCSLPLRIMSRCWGWLAACQVPTTLRPYIYGWYSSAFNVNLDEALYTDYEHYSTLAEFFTRPLRDGVRVIDTTAPLVSPADGKVLHFGSATNSLIEQVKGVNYSIESFLGPPTWMQRTVPHSNKEYAEAIKEKHDGSTQLFQCVIYLAPGDYHRFHSPAEWEPTLRRHFDGELLSVSPKIATWMPDLFCLNERVLYLGQWQHGFFSYTAVGATNVGSVQIYKDEKLKTNRWVGLRVGKHKCHQCDEVLLPQQEKMVFKRGDLIGQFNMGSTIVLLFEAPVNFKFNIKAGQQIRVGQQLGDLA